MASVPWARRPGRGKSSIFGQRSGAGRGWFELSIMGVRTGSRREGGLPGRAKNASMMLGLRRINESGSGLPRSSRGRRKGTFQHSCGLTFSPFVGPHKKIRRAARLERARSRIDPGRNTCKTRA